MCKAAAPYGVRLVARFAFASVTAALLAGCADTSRFTGDPLGNPFRTATTDPAPTGSLERGRRRTTWRRRPTSRAPQ